MAKVYLGLGSNLHNPEKNINLALQKLEPVGRIFCVSSLCEADPARYKDQPWFFQSTADLSWRPALSTLFMGAFLGWFRGLNFLLLVPSSLLLYLATLVALGTFTQEEITIIKELIPLRRQPPEEVSTPR